VAVAGIVDGVHDDPGAERLDPLCNPMKTAQDCARKGAAEQVIAAGS
jgi:hypothetical protein